MVVPVAATTITITTAIATPSSLSCALDPSWQGLRGSLGPARSLPWEKKQRQCRRKAGEASICAQFEQKPPPYPLDALEPHMSKMTLEYHWGKHQRLCR